MKQAAAAFFCFFSSCAAPERTSADCAAEATLDDEGELMTLALREEAAHEGAPRMQLVHLTAPSRDLAPFVEDSRLGADLLARNENPLRIDSFIGDVGVPMVLITDDAVPRSERGFDNEPGFRVARPGMGCHEALVYVDMVCGELCGEGHVLRFARDAEGEPWDLVENIRRWIS